MAKRGKHGNEKISHKITSDEKRIVKWFLDREWHRAKKDDYWEHYLYCMGWLYCNSMVLSGVNPLKKALRSIEIIKEKDLEVFQNYINTCTNLYNHEIDKLPPKNNIVPLSKVADNKSEVSGKSNNQK